MLEDVTVSVITERRHSQPWGLCGGDGRTDCSTNAPSRSRRATCCGCSPRAEEAGVRPA